MTVRLLADTERMVSRFLRDQPEVAALVADRVYTELPRDKTFPLVRVWRVGGDADTGPLLWVDRGQLQIDAWGNSKAEANQIIETCRAVLAGRLIGIQPEGVVSRVRFFGLQYQPDPDAPSAQGRARPRYLVTLEATAHPT